MGRKRNKKKVKTKRKGSEGFAFPTPLASILVMAAVTSLVYLWLHGRCEALGSHLQKMERQYEQVHHRVLNEESKWSNLRSLPSVKRMLRRHHIEMNWPSEDRVVRLALPDDEPLFDDTTGYRQLAQAGRVDD